MNELDEEEECVFCKTLSKSRRYPAKMGGMTFYECPICGRYEITDNALYNYDKNKTRQYLYYNKIEIDQRGYYFLGSDVQLELKQKEDESGNFICLSNDTINNWYPKTFEEKVNYILLKLNKLLKYLGAYINIDAISLLALFFANEISTSPNDICNELRDQVKFMGNALIKSDFIDGKLYESGNMIGEIALWQLDGCKLTTRSITRIYELQKNQVNSKNIFVAMEFGEETQKLRYAIKEVITKLGYIAIIMDEVEHNKQIVQEMLYEIKGSKMVIAELSTGNLGAYYEAGYANALGKEVIHLCNKQAFDTNIHFDVRQINTIIYDKDDLEQMKNKLEKRIKATIGD